MRGGIFERVMQIPQITLKSFEQIIVKGEITMASHVNKLLYWTCFSIPFILIAFFYNSIPQKVVGFDKLIFIGYYFAVNLGTLLFINYRFKHFYSEKTSKTIKALDWMIMILMNTIPCLIIFYAATTHLSLSLVKVISVLCGFVFLIFGITFPKIKYNKVVGIKTKWTLMDERVWIKTHQFSSVLWLIGGSMLIGNLFSITQFQYVTVLFVALFIILVLPFWYSYKVWKDIQK